MAVALGKEMVALRIVAVPVVAPRVRLVAAPPIFNVVAVVLNRLAVPAVVVSDPPLKAPLPAEVTLPVPPATEKLVPVISLAPSAIALPISGSETSIAVVIAPPPEEVILRAVGKVRSVSLLSISTSWVGAVALTPSASAKIVELVEPLAVVTVKLESVLVSAKVKEISRASVVTIVLPES